MRRRRNARTAKWFAAYTLVMLAVAAFSFTASEFSIGTTILLTAIVFAFLTWHMWRKSRRPAR